MASSYDKWEECYGMASAASATISWYRTPLPPGVLKQLNRRDDFKGLLQAGGHLILVLITGGFSIYAFTQNYWGLLVLLLFLHGTVCAFLANAAHELVHGTVFNRTYLNSSFLYCFSFIRWFPPEYYWRIHTAHHQYTLYPEQDRDPELFPDQNAPGKIASVSLKEFLTQGFFNPFNLQKSLRRTVRHSRGLLKDQWEYQLFSNPHSRRKVVNWARVLLLGHVGIAVAAIYSGYWIITVVVSLTPCYGGALQLLCNHPQHAGLKKSTPDFRLSCRTIKLNPIFRFLYWNMNYHIEHHMYAAVPCYNLGTLHRYMEHDLPPSRTGLLQVWREIVEIQRRQAEHPDYYYEQPLPKSYHGG